MAMRQLRVLLFVAVGLWTRSAAQWGCDGGADCGMDEGDNDDMSILQSFGSGQGSRHVAQQQGMPGAPKVRKTARATTGGQARQQPLQ
eukprot:CAMPEP_0176085156 /NCGR_PEP_ID=MMETSP0120_2-20121206/42619_1 /TAXON_ID=160619 /ORGANISM="Kryptoperidinium foliaceum, Strain CCMP 1326" /LENGTH=87 /DNA_ID=CAMNT_0017418971 /DNA_START=63 /DNA_END=326 /DNA_ORIENTATION=-